ncbi:MAG: SIMPL domain-containing protein [Candidatus Komeilibacteria bacterium]|nr:SIMPL domain-containing protein [Candidatus Komeilibacteria bacterium]
MENQDICVDCNQQDCGCEVDCCSGGQKRFWLWLAVAIILGAIVVVAILRDRLVNNQQWSVNIVGQGKISVKPDLAKVTVGIETAKTFNAAEAYKTASEAMVKITQAIKAVGIVDQDLQTADYSLNPVYQYDNGQNNLSGYQALQTVTVTVRDLSKMSSLIEKVTSAGANRINNVMFTVEDMDEFKNEARLKAVADAKSKSAEYAKVVGVRLGDITGWWENFIQVPYQAYNYPYGGEKGGIGGGGGAAGVSNPVPYGPMDVVVEMNLTYQIK